MNPEFKSKIEINPDTGQRCLIVFYDSEADDFDETFEKAMACHGIKNGQMNIIAIPESLRHVLWVKF